LDFYFFQYAAYSIINLDTVNVYTPATMQDLINEKAYAEKLCREAQARTLEIRDMFIKNGDSSVAVIGTTREGVSWHAAADSINASYFYNSNYDAIYNAYPFETDAANARFLYDAITKKNDLLFP
jgi:hypothetical protein